VDSFKYIESSDGTQELFDLRTDPEETRNIAAMERVRVTRFAERVQELVGDAPSTPAAAISAVPDEIGDELRSQGYRL
jgi:hypothetical protein